MAQFLGKLESHDLIEWRNTVARYEALQFAGQAFSKEEAVDVARRFYEHAAELGAVYIAEEDQEDTAHFSIMADTGRIVACEQ